MYSLGVMTYLRAAARVVRAVLLAVPFLVGLLVAACVLAARWVWYAAVEGYRLLVREH